jgi:hypothetical protein
MVESICSCLCDCAVPLLTRTLPTTHCVSAVRPRSAVPQLPFAQVWPSMMPPPAAAAATAAPSAAAAPGLEASGSSSSLQCEYARLADDFRQHGLDATAVTATGAWFDTGVCVRARVRACVRARVSGQGALIVRSGGMLEPTCWCCRPLCSMPCLSASASNATAAPQG